MPWPARSDRPRQLRVEHERAVESAEEGEGEADQGARVVERAQDEPADLLRGGHRGRDDVAVLGDAPRATLQRLTRA